MSQDRTSIARGDQLGSVLDGLPIDLEYYDDRYIQRRIAARQRRTGARSQQAYLRRLETEPDEQAALKRSLSINVTGFFRNPEVWIQLRDQLRQLTSSQRRVRVWSAACADGREPYSIALLSFDDPQIDPNRIEIVASDISEDALETARAGEYQSRATTDISKELSPLREPTKYVEQHGDTFRVESRIRNMVEFTHHDLIRDGPRENKDIVLCRNVLIYIDRSLESKIFDTVAESLRTNGLLVVGMTESALPERSKRFEAVERQYRIYRKR